LKPMPLPGFYAYMLGTLTHDSSRLAFIHCQTKKLLSTGAVVKF
jgi:hypothetical protein